MPRLSFFHSYRLTLMTASFLSQPVTMLPLRKGSLPQRHPGKAVSSRWIQTAFLRISSGPARVVQRAACGFDEGVDFRFAVRRRDEADLKL